jgi:hypothetical protein
MGFKFDGKKVKADMTKNLGYAQAGATKFIEKAGAAASTAKQMGGKATGQAIAGKAINAFGKGMKLAKANPAILGATVVGMGIQNTINRIKTRRAKK